MFDTTLHLPGFSREFVNVIIRVYVFTKGFAGAILLYSALPLFRNVYGLSGLEYQTYSTIAILPWTMKPLVGAIVDTFPICGFRKKNYVILAIVLGALSVGSLSFDTPITLSTMFLFGGSFSVMMIDLIYEGEYSSIMAFKNGSTKMPSFVWACIMVGSVFGAIFVGPLGDNGDIRYAYPLAAIAIIQLGFSLIRNAHHSFKNDKILSYSNADLSESILTKTSIVYKTPINTREWILCISMAITSILLMILLFTGKQYPWSTAAFAGLCAICLHAYAYYVYHSGAFSKSMNLKAHQLWTYNLFMFLIEAFYINISGAQDFWYTADDTCVANGPHFSLSLYTTTVTIISAIAGACSAGLYTKTLMNRSIRSAIQFAIVFQVMTAITDIVIAKRWNQTKLGISDEVLFLLGDAVITPVATMLKLIPMAILTSKIVEKGKETMTYSLLAGFQNLGSVVSKIIGIALIQAFDIQTTAPNCFFEYYPALLLFAHMIMPMLSFVLAYVMLPCSSQ